MAALSGMLGVCGVVGDGDADDSAGINAFSSAMVASGSNEIHLDAGRTYRIGSSLQPRQNVMWNFHGSTIVSGAGIGIFANPSDTTKVPIGQVTSDVVGPTSQLPLSSVAGLSLGAWVAVRLGNNPWDNGEPRYAVAAQVQAIVGNTITLDWVIPYSIPIVSGYTYVQQNGTQIVVPPATVANSTIYLLQNDFPLNVTFRNGTLQGDTGPSVEGGFFLRWGVNIKFEDIIGNPGNSGDMGAGLFGLMQFSRHVRINNPLLGCNTNTRGQSSLGRMFNFSNCIDVVVNGAVAKDCHNVVAFCESFCEGVTFNEPYIVNRGAVALASNWTGIFVGQGSRVSLRNPTFVTDVAIQTFYDSGGTDYGISVDGTFTWRGPLGHFAFSSADMHGVFDFANPADGQIVKPFSDRYHTVQNFGLDYGGFAALSSF